VKDEDSTVTIMLIHGVEGDCLAIDGFRVWGPKPWGGGTIVKEWEVSKADIYQALGILDCTKGRGSE
jgi:hypothetical protein